MDPGWMVEEQETKEVEPRLPRIPKRWLSQQSRKSSLYVVRVQDNNGEDPNLLPIGEIKPRHKIRSKQTLRYVRCKVFRNSRSTVGFSRLIRTSAVYWLIQSSNRMTLGGNG